MRLLINCFEEIISPNNLWQSWLDYRKGKRNRRAVAEFERNLDDQLCEIKFCLENGSYQHSGYQQFVVFDPKRRIISAPSIKDHIIHRVIYNILYPFYDRTFSPFSFSCRNKKGLHRSILILRKFIRKNSGKNIKNNWILHGDIKKCFDSIDRDLLTDLLERRIKCFKTMELLKKIIYSYYRGIPLGNLTSQLFVNIYLDSLDKYVKEKIKIKRYLRYADDFIIVANSKDECEKIANLIRIFLKEKLKLDFPISHQKIYRLSQGIESLGFKFCGDHYKICPRARRRIKKHFIKRVQKYRVEQISAKSLNCSWQSLKGLLKWGCNYQFKKELLLVATK